MARYKYIDTHPRLLAVDLSQQLLPGTFEHALKHLLDHAVDLSHFDARFRNDATGARPYPPALLFKVVFFAYSQGIVSSQQIERACQEHVTFIALCGAPTASANRPTLHTACHCCDHRHAHEPPAAHQMVRMRGLEMPQSNARLLLRGPSIRCAWRPQGARAPSVKAMATAMQG